MSPKPPLPELSIDRAIELARDHLTSNEVNLNEQSLLEVRWTLRSVDNTWCWTLTWMTLDQLLVKTSQASRRGGGMLEVLVIDEGQVSHSFAR